MGLDMYLSKKIYVGANYEHNRVTGRIDITKEEKKLTVQFNRVTYIVEQVAYWRKSNQIHKWFVDNVQKGVDDCKEYYVPTEKLQELLALCKQVKRSHKKAEELLPTESGFFFGGTEFDEYYYEDIKNTIDMLEQILDEDADGDYYYQSSW